MSSRYNIDHSFKNLWGNWRISVCAVPVLVAAAASLGVSGASFSQDGGQGLTLSATAEGEYSDNYLRLSDAKMTERPSLVPEEYSLRTNAQLGWNQRIGRQQLSFNADVGYRFNKNNKYLDTESVATDAALNWKLGSKCNGAITATYSRSQGDFETVDDLLHNVINQKNAAADINCRFATRLGVVVNADIADGNNSTVQRSINDLKQHQVGAGLRLTMRGGDHVSLMARKMWRRYDNRVVAFNLVDKNEQLNFGVEVQKSFGPRITVDGWAGYSKVTNQNLPIMNYDGFSGKASISYDIGGRHQIIFGGRKEIDSSTGLTASYIKAQSMYTRLTSRWGAKMHSEFGVSQDERDIALVPGALSVGTLSNSYDKTKIARASFGYDIGRLVTLRLSGRLAKRNARLDYFDYTEKAVMFGLSFKYE